jgi:hypothetical protein
MPDRVYGPTNGEGTLAVFAECHNDRFQPAGRGFRVVVDEGDQVGGCRIEAAVTGVGEPGARFFDVCDREGAGG